MLLSYVLYLNRYICIPFDLQVDAVVSVQAEKQPFFSLPFSLLVKSLSSYSIYEMKLFIFANLEF